MADSGQRFQVQQAYSSRRNALGEQLSVILPAILAILLFVGVSYGVFLPAFRSSIMERKKELVQQQVNTVTNLISHQHQLAQRGVIDSKEAKDRAMQAIRALRYGKENKDYFWINDMQGRMVMHPYRPDLEGKSLNNLLDSHGNRFVYNFVKIVKEQGQGFAPYFWQWMDDPDRIVPKLAYVKGFPKWGWIVGTGIYLADMEQEVNRLSHNIAYASGAGFGLIVLLSLYMIRHGLKVSQQRRQAELQLQEYHGHLEELVKLRTAALADTNQELESKIKELERTTAEREHLISELKQAMSTVKSLAGLLPICASCKKIRDEHNHWETMESYISQRTDADFSHSICPDCAEKLYYGALRQKDVGRAAK